MIYVRERFSGFKEEKKVFTTTEPLPIKIKEVFKQYDVHVIDDLGRNYAKLRGSVYKHLTKIIPKAKTVFIGSEDFPKEGIYGVEWLKIFVRRVEEGVWVWMIKRRE